MECATRLSDIDASTYSELGVAGNLRSRRVLSGVDAGLEAVAAQTFQRRPGTAAAMQAKQAVARAKAAVADLEVQASQQGRKQ